METSNDFNIFLTVF